MSLKQGLIAEQQALQYLSKQGLKWIASNYRCRLGEIDIIMHDKDYLVFIEVRARKNANFGKAVETITYAKQLKLIKAATFYLSVMNQHNCKTRFDVVTIDDHTQIQWIKNAFTVG